jgi:hypothetical protein
VRSASLENFLRIPFCTCGACSVPPYDRGLTSVCRSCSRLRAETQLSRIGYKCADAERTKVEELGAAGTEGDLPVSGGVLENKIRTALNASIVQAGEKFLRLRAQAWLCRPFTFQKCRATERRAPCKPLTRNRTIRPQLGWRCSLCTDCRLQHAGTRNAQLRRVRCSGDLIPPYGTTHERTLPPPNPPPPPPSPAHKSRCLYLTLSQSTSRMAVEPSSLCWLCRTNSWGCHSSKGRWGALRLPVVCRARGLHNWPQQASS